MRVAETSKIFRPVSLQGAHLGDHPEELDERHVSSGHQNEPGEEEKEEAGAIEEGAQACRGKAPCRGDHCQFQGHPEDRFWSIRTL